MRLPRAQITVRSLMIAVAVVGLVCGAEILRRRRSAFLERAGHEASLEDFSRRSESLARKTIALAEREAAASRRSSLEHRERAAAAKGNVALELLEAHGLEEHAKDADKSADDYRSILPGNGAYTEHHGRLRLKYERAARYPWLPVAPDPPEPPETRFLLRWGDLP